MVIRVSNVINEINVMVNILELQFDNMKYYEVVVNKILIYVINEMIMKIFISINITNIKE